MDKTRHYYTLCNAAPPVDTPPLPGTPVSTNKALSSLNDRAQTQTVDDGFGEEHHYLEEDNMFEDKEGDDLGDVENYDDAESKSNDTVINTLENIDRGNDHSNINTNPKQKSNEQDTLIDDVPDSEKGKKEDQGIYHDSPSGLHYRAGDEPEPIDLTHLNIEAAMMCLASKVRLVSGRAESPNMSSRTFRFKEVDSNVCDTKNDITKASFILRTNKEVPQNQNPNEKSK